jgi:hypothetical protein
MRRRLLLLAPIVPLLLAASACSGGSNDTSGSARPVTADGPSSVTNPCRLVAAEQLAPLVGAAPATTGPTEQFRGTTCHWESRAASGASLDLTVWPGREFFSTSPGAVSVAGLGDEAETDGPAVARVIWRQGDITAQLVGLGLGAGGAEQVVALARSISSRL